MKVDSKHIANLFVEIKSLLDGIDQVFREGEYVEEGISSIAENIKTMLSAFTIDNMTPVTAETKKEHYFIQAQERLMDKRDAGVGLTPEENVLFFQARFYITLKKQAAKQELPINCHQADLETYLENEVICNTPYESYFNTDFNHTMYQTIKLVAREIMAHRKKHPQITMAFDKPSDQQKSKNLIDII
ncbi:hypothetical protein ACFS5N_16385 [Mucilaginibacter ximonensis]|uniref:RteC protein n=1 Tax=Mucilaginibacter ximonensis TaxID=538021 RepID=A0ABW5YFF8_9SPHI